MIRLSRKGGDKMGKFKVFRSPQVTVYGQDAFSQVGKETFRRGTKALIVSDKIMENLGYIKQCIAYLHEENVQCEIYTGVASEPTDRYVEEALSLFKIKNCDVIISLGGR